MNDEVVKVGLSTTLPVFASGTLLPFPDAAPRKILGP